MKVWLQRVLLKLAVACGVLTISLPVLVVLAAGSEWAMKVLRFAAPLLGIAMWGVMVWGMVQAFRRLGGASAGASRRVNWPAGAQDAELPTCAPAVSSTDRPAKRARS